MKNILKIYFFRAGLTLAAPLNFFHNETFFSSNEKVNHNENEDLWKSIFFG